jgi:diadenosine tetraphosphate (Ap4A) HIT family hydrolase
LFCSIAAGITDPGVCLAVNNEFVIFPALHQRPNNRGQMLLVPAAHYGGLADMPPEKAYHLLTGLQAATQAVKVAFQASGTTVRLNLGPPAQEIFHLHWHITPRHVGDDFKTSKSAEVTLDDRLEQTARLAHHLVKRASRAVLPG